MRIKLEVHEHYTILLSFVNRENYIISIVFFLLMRIIFKVHAQYTILLLFVNRENYIIYRK